MLYRLCCISPPSSAEDGGGAGSGSGSGAGSSGQAEPRSKAEQTDQQRETDVFELFNARQFYTLKGLLNKTKMPMVR